jgi:hypothetical protein
MIGGAGLCLGFLHEGRSIEQTADDKTLRKNQSCHGDTYARFLPLHYLE